MASSAGRGVAAHARLAHEAVTSLGVSDPQEVQLALRKLRQTFETTAASKSLQQETFADLFAKRGGVDAVARILQTFVVTANLRSIIEDALASLVSVLLAAPKRAAKAAISAECDTKFLLETVRACVRNHAIVEAACAALRILVDHDTGVAAAVKACRGTEVLTQAAVRHMRHASTAQTIVSLLHRLCRSNATLDAFARSPGLGGLVASFPKALDKVPGAESSILALCALASARGDRACKSLEAAGVCKFAIDCLVESNGDVQTAANALTILQRVELEASESLMGSVFDRLYPLLGLYLGRDALLLRLCCVLWKLHPASLTWDMNQLFEVPLTPADFRCDLIRARLAAGPRVVPTSACYKSILYDQGADLHDKLRSPAVESALAIVHAIHGRATLASKYGTVFDWRGPGAPVSLPSQLRFDCGFEGGNLGRVEHLGGSWYALWLRADTNSYGQLQWFYFAIEGLRPGATYNFVMMNLEKTDSMYNSGMRPLMFCPGAAERHGVGWRRVGSRISYFETPFTKDGNAAGASGCKVPIPCYAIHIEFAVPEVFRESDTVYMAYCFPYTYANLLEDLEELRSKACVEETVLCQTLGGVNCPVLTLTSPDVPDFHEEVVTSSDDADDDEDPPRTEAYLESSSKALPRAERQHIFLSARVHPGESNSSFMMRGALGFLTSDDARAQALRDRYVFKIVPMLNPDGVIAGNHRCNLAGLDLNRQWASPDEAEAPTVFALRKLMRSAAATSGIALFVDMHGHSRKAGVFCYGCEDKKTFGAPERVYPLLVDATASRECFHLHECSFKVQKSKAACARVAVWRELRVASSFTLEASMCGNGERHFVVPDLEHMGRDAVAALWHFADPAQLEVSRANQKLQLEFPKRFLAAPETVDDEEGKGDPRCDQEDRSGGGDDAQSIGALTSNTSSSSGTSSKGSRVQSKNCKSKASASLGNNVSGTRCRPFQQASNCEDPEALWRPPTARARGKASGTRPGTRRITRRRPRKEHASP